MEGDEPKKKTRKVTTLRTTAVEIVIPPSTKSTRVQVYRTRSGRTNKKTTVNVKSCEDCTVTAIDE